MPAPKFLAGLPKPLLFGLYGAAGGFLGALFIAEPIYQIVLHLQDDLRNGFVRRDDTQRVILLLFGAAAWTASFAAAICLALVAGQQHYLRGALLSGTQFTLGLLGGALAGCLGGFVGQFCFCFAPQDFLSNCLVRIFAWALLGGLVGLGVAFFIPNMQRALGLAGGTVGGGVGCVLFLMASFAAGDTIGRIIGGTVLGFCIGVMVVVAEAAFRRAWLEVRYSEREVITVNLGPEPVKVGSDAKVCTVWARGARSVALRFFVRDGQVICDEPGERAETVAEDGDTRDVGKVTVTVRICTDDADEPRQRKRRQTRPTAPRPRDQEEDHTPAAALPAPLPLPARPPAIKPATPNPNACPGCGRVIPGRVGARYCMVCDQTY